MTSPPPAPTTRSGGFLLAIAIIAGVAIGAWRGQATIGFLGGLAAGLLLLVLVWLRDRAR